MLSVRENMAAKTIGPREMRAKNEHKKMGGHQAIRWPPQGGIATRFSIQTQNVSFNAN
jgi:hypothetical protein